MTDSIASRRIAGSLVLAAAITAAAVADPVSNPGNVIIAILDDVSIDEL